MPQTETAPLIFLDIDGVLNSYDFLYSTIQKIAREETMYMEGNEHLSIDPKAVARLNRVLAATGAKVVISSSWRWGTPLPQLIEILGKVGFVGEVIDITPMTRFDERGKEIQQWFDEHGGKGRAFPDGGWSTPNVILDDDSDMAHLLHKLVKTSFQEGLQDPHVEKLIAMLQG